MAERINRDAGHPVDLTNPTTLAQYEGFAADVPSTEGMIDAVNNPPAVPTANSVRAAQLLRPSYLLGRPAVTDLPPPDEIGANIRYERQGLHGFDMPVPSANGGIWANVEMWTFRDRLASGGADGWPGPMIRVRQGQAVHSVLSSASGPHTIHHHGIEPTPMNDGVGHLTFEVAGGHYTYQWVAAEAGTYFYHCHRNTTLHFERGMYGPLIIDPPEGPGFTHVGTNLATYDAEAIWVVDDIDTRWHGVEEDAGGNLISYGTGLALAGVTRPRQVVDHVASGLQDLGPGKLGDAVNPFTLITDLDNPRLHDFDPNVFAVTGVPVPVDPTPRPEPGGFRPAIPRSVDNHRLTGVGVTVNAGAKILVRTLNASYYHQRWAFPQAIPGQVIACDGRTLGGESWGARYSSPFSLASIDHQFLLSVARRWDVLLDTTGVAAGTYDVAVSLHASVGDARIVTIRLPITVR